MSDTAVMALIATAGSILASILAGVLTLLTLIIQKRHDQKIAVLETQQATCERENEWLRARVEALGKADVKDRAELEAKIEKVANGNGNGNGH